MMYGYPDNYSGRYNSLILTYDEFGDELDNKLGEAIKLLITAGYECVVRYDEPGLGIVSIEYNYDRYKDYGNEIAYWLTDEEEEILATYRDIEEDCMDDIVVYEAVKERDCEAHFFHSREEAYKYLDGAAGWIEKIEFDD